MGIVGCRGRPLRQIRGPARRSARRDEEYRKYYPYFTNRRHFFLPSSLGRIIGKPLLFSLSNGWAKYYQVDTIAGRPAMADEF